MQLSPAPDAALFDFDGVIIDSRVAVRTALNDALVEHGYGSRPGLELDAFIGPPTLVALTALTGERDVSALAETYHERYASIYLAETRLIDGIDAALGAITIPLALATAKPAEFVAPLLRELGIGERFAVVCAPSMSELQEPKRDTVARALAELGTRNAVMVGDRSYDIEAARANEIPAIGVTWGIGDRAELEQAGAELIVERPAALVALLNAT